MADQQPLISIIIPTYNGEAFIGRAIESVLKQTYENWELLVVDDGSKDRTAEVVKDFIARDHRIKYFHELNSGGPSRPTNFAINHAKGEYLAFLDHDDYWLPSKLFAQVRLALKGFDLVVCHGLVERAGQAGMQKIKVPVFADYTRTILEKNYIMSMSAVMIRATVTKTAGLFDEHLCGPQDWDFYIRVLTAGFSLGVVDEFLYVHVLSSGHISAQITTTIYEKQRQHIFNKYREFYKDKRLYSNYLRSVGVQYQAFGLASKARDFFGDSLRHNVFNFRSYAYYFLTFFGKGLFNFLIGIKNFFLARRLKRKV